jgi:hypothetical protein
MMSDLQRRTINLLVALMLGVCAMVALSGCEKKSDPQKAGEEVGEAAEEAGEHQQKAAAEAGKK